MKPFLRPTLYFVILLLCGFPCLASDKIEPADTLPETTPWDLEALSQPPKYEWSDGKKVRSLYYQGQPYRGKPTRVFAYYATPGTLCGDTSIDKNLPVIVLVHGGGGTAFSEWAELWARRGYAAIAMDLRCSGPHRQPIDDGGPELSHDVVFGHIDKPITDQWPYHAVSDVILAHSLIRSFPEVDPDRTAITGISWGGYLTCIVSGLDNRFKAAVPVYGCGFLYENSTWLEILNKMSPDDRAKWIQLWDPSKYVGSASIPMLFVNGGQDFAYPPDSHAKTYALVKSEKNLRFSPQLAHGHIFDRPKAVEIFIDQHIKGTTPLPRIGKVAIDKDRVMAEVDTKTKLVSAQICYTKDKLPGVNTTRKWVEKSAKIEGNCILADPAPADATIWFLTVTDERGATVSSELVFSNEIGIDGYKSIWYSNQPQDNEYVYKYSGGMGTYCAKHRPLAIYSKEADKTFFCYGGTTENNSTLLHMVSYFDHKTGMVPRPVALVDKQTIDAHDNPSISIDDAGHIWIFSSSHGTSRPSYLWVSERPYDISDFQQVHTKAFATDRFETNFSYTQPHYIPGKGFLFLMTLYRGGRTLFSSNSADGYTWSEPQPYAKIEKGHYQVSERCGNRVGTAFNYHPRPKGLNWRTNLYYIETADLGKTWTTVDGKSIKTPLTDPKNPALIHDYRAENKNVYMKDLAFDANGNPVVLYVTSGGWEAGPKNDPRTWCTARWTGKEWDIRGSITSDNNYDTGSLYIESDGTWRIIGPTETGPQAYNPGGEVAMWISKDQGKSWQKVKQLTENSDFNHSYCRRPVNAHPDFYAFWADGHGRRPSESRLYFTNRKGDHVWKLPEKMKGEFAKPEIVK